MKNLTPVRGEQISVSGRAKSNQIMDNLYIQFPVDFVAVPGAEWPGQGRGCAATATETGRR